MKIEFITDRLIYQKVLLEKVPKAHSFLWLGTSDLKDLYIHSGRRMVPFVKVLSELAQRRVSIRLLHAKEPGKRFRQDFDRYPILIEGTERMLCPRVHFKMAIVDGTFAYCGSANLTGAGMGAKSENHRNFESGFITADSRMIEAMMGQFDGIWRGDFCGACRRKEFCAQFQEILNGRK
jgi:phosphatidylserine/phosphatidylglycerophosphate/cardiolipin synthase-like enzyme